MCTTTEPTTLHPFERRGLGKAPFKFIGMKHQEIAYGGAVIGAIGGVAVITKPGGTCDACGTYIVDMYRIQSADGKISVVGCDCILKLAREDNRLVSDVAKAKKENDRKKNLARKNAQLAKDRLRINAAMDLLDSSEPVRVKLRAMPHPKFAGSNALDYVYWMRENAGNSGKLVIAKLIEDAAK
jgi:hypothetical protein